MRGLPGWTSEVRSALAGKSEELTRLAVEMYARGLSMRDIEAAFTDQSGRCVLSRTAASAVCERLWDEYQAFAQRDLGELDIVYLFIADDELDAAQTTPVQAPQKLGPERLGLRVPDLQPEHLALEIGRAHV